jgi:hypothetical protein
MCIMIIFAFTFQTDCRISLLAVNRHIFVQLTLTSVDIKIFSSVI